MNFHAAADFVQQRNCQFAAEMFAKFFEAGQNLKISIRALIQVIRLRTI